MANGQDIEVVNHVWILDKAIAGWPTFVNVDIPDNMKVAELLSDEGIWDGVRLLHYFGAPLAAIIAQIPIEASLPRDKIELIKSSIGSTITAVTYSWQFEDCEDPVCVIYKLRLRPREKLFWWRLYKVSRRTLGLMSGGCRTM